MNAPGFLPNWLQKHLIPHMLSAVIGVGSFAIVSFYNNLTEQRTQNLRIENLEREQRKNTEYRLKHDQEWADFKEQYREDMGSVLAGQRDIEKELKANHGRH